MDEETVLMPPASLPYNRCMSHLDILLPFGLPAAEMAGDVVGVLNTPSLAYLISRTASRRHDEFDPFSRSLPHEVWLARRFGLKEDPARHGSLPVAGRVMQNYGLAATAGTWFLLHPIHLHIARDHLVLTNQRRLSLSEDESRALFNTASALFEESGKTLLYGDTHTWFVRADGWEDMLTATPDAAAGRNIDIWLPQGHTAREWRKLQNEIQMHWHGHAVNAEREARGEKPVNSVWMWGGAAAASSFSAAPYGKMVNLSGWAGMLAPPSAAHETNHTAEQIIAAAPARGLIFLEQLMEPALSADWSEWINRLQELESEWFAPIFKAAKAGTINTVSLILSDGSRLSAFTCGKTSLRKFWIKPTLANLLS